MDRAGGALNRPAASERWSRLDGSTILWIDYQSNKVTIIITEPIMGVTPTHPSPFPPLVPRPNISIPGGTGRGPRHQRSGTASPNWPLNFTEDLEKNIDQKKPPSRDLFLFGFLFCNHPSNRHQQHLLKIFLETTVPNLLPLDRRRRHLRQKPQHPHC